MIQYVVFDVATGEPIKWGQCQADLLEVQAGPGEKAIATSSLSVEANRLVIWNAVRDARDAHIDGGAMTPSGAVDSDSLARSNVSGATIAALVAKLNSVPYSITWTMLDNTPITLDADGMIGMGMAVLAHVNACHERARELRAEIEAAANMAELLAIDVMAGWP